MRKGDCYEPKCTAERKIAPQEYAQPVRANVRVSIIHYTSFIGQLIARVSPESLAIDGSGAPAPTSAKKRLASSAFGIAPRL